MKKNIYLLIVNLTVSFKELYEYLLVIVNYYLSFTFFKWDTALLSKYIFDCPYGISKRFLMERGESNVYAYGETPLTSLDRIIREAEIQPKDHFYELGCGRGRGCFFVHARLKCSVVGIDFVPTFIQNAKAVKAAYGIEGIEFIQGDFTEVEMEDATVVYLYGTCLEEETVQGLKTKFKRLKPGTKIITVSEGLNETEQETFKLIKSFPCRFNWGKADVFVHEVVSIIR